MIFPPWRYPHIWQLWQDWLNSGQHQQLDLWLSRWFKHHKQYGKKDRKLYADVLFGGMRYLQLCCALESHYQQGVNDWAQWDEQWQIGSCAKIDPAAFWYWLLLRLNADAPAPRELDDASARNAFFTGIASQWPQQAALSSEYLLYHGLRPRWRAALAERQQMSNWQDSQLQLFITRQNQQAPTWLRAQNLDVNEAKQQLLADGIKTTLTGTMLCAENAASVSKTALYQSGNIEIQDAASQLIASYVKPTAQQTIWDACAGAGGKSLAIATANPSSQVIASDIRANALTELRRRAERAKLKNISTLILDASNQDAYTALPEPFDWLLIDAPCSAAGTWRRSPDSRWRLETSLTEFITLQQQLLQMASQQLKPKGFLVYATCSWLVDENEAQIAQFLHANKHLALVDKQLLGNPNIDADTMFVAVLQNIE